MMDAPAHYEHVQDAPRWVMAWATVYGILMLSLAIWLIWSDDVNPLLALTIAALIGAVYVVVLGATRLTTRVTAANVELSFRFGWPHKTISRGAITGSAEHRNSWLAGWGIRKVIGGWMWNVYGLDSVELELDTGRKFRIGTDDAAGLMAALRS